MGNDLIIANKDLQNHTQTKGAIQPKGATQTTGATQTKGKEIHSGSPKTAEFRIV
jgi:hypothetical protein